MENNLVQKGLIFSKNGGKSWRFFEDLRKIHILNEGGILIGISNNLKLKIFYKRFSFDYGYTWKDLKINIFLNYSIIFSNILKNVEFFSILKYSNKLGIFKFSIKNILGILKF